MDRKRILLVIPNFGIGGAQRVFHDHAKTFSKFHDVEEVVFDRNHDRRVYDSGNYLNDLRQGPKFLKLFGALGRLISRSIALNRLVKTKRIDLVISHMDGANWVNVLSCSSAKKILVVHGSVLHDLAQSSLRKWLRVNLISKIVYNRATLTVAVSDGIKFELNKHCRIKNVVVINNYFDTQIIKKASDMRLDSKEEWLFKRPCTLITSGRLSVQKQQSMFLRVGAELKRRGVAMRLIVLGDGELRNDLLKESSLLGMQAYHIWGSKFNSIDDADVCFLGYVDNPFKYLAKATLFLFPSAWEGFPMALCEAMICGVPVLSADCPTGPREILSPGSINYDYDLIKVEVSKNGILLPMTRSTDSVSVWADAVQKVLRENDLRQQLISHARSYMKQLDSSYVISKWRHLIDVTLNAE